MTEPFVTAALAGIGGTLKTEPAHFVVEEIPLYEPSGAGEHLYVTITREGFTTRAIEERLAALFDLHDVDVGCAGLKDKHARATQTFSLRMKESDVQQRIEDALPVKVVAVTRHVNKLKRGHLLGNRFQIVVAAVASDALDRARAVAAALLPLGWPNYYGTQRFGMHGDNAARGREALLGGGPRRRWERQFLLSAYQSALFNRWLAERLTRGDLDRLLPGDIAKKTDTGGLFEVTGDETARFERGEITYTGPIYGAELWWAGGEAGAHERAILEREGVTTEMLKRARLPGSRRPARIRPTELTMEPHPEGLRFEFTLPKGAYATTLLREFMKSDLPDTPELESL